MISIIVTAYNAEKTIERCLNSILNNKYDDYEIIVVNDGSTDKTEEIVQLFASEKIRYYYEENKGVSSARNLGLKESKGEYITFVDSDDYVANNYFEGLEEYINCKEEEQIEIIKRKAIIINENTKEEKKIEGPSFKKVTGEEAFNRLCFEDKFLDTLWSYIIKKKIFEENNFKFKEGKYHEDFGLLPLIILKAKTFVSLDEYVYYYIQSENSIMREKNEEKTMKKAEDAIYHYDNILENIQKYDITKKTKENVRIYCTNAILLKVNELEGKKQKEYIKQLKIRKIYRNIKVRNIKQLIKKILLFINIQFYTKHFNKKNT